MSLHVRSGGTWREGTPYARQGSAWHPWKQAWVRRNGSWVEFYGQSGTYDIGIAYRPNQTNDKIIIPARRGYWFNDSQWGTGQLATTSTTMARTTGLEISREDYALLYDDGLVDIEPELFFNERDIAMQADMGIMETQNGSISPSDQLNQYTINAIIDINWDGYTTGRTFQVELLGQGIPASTINNVAIYNGTTLVRNLAASLAQDRGKSSQLSDGAWITRWTWATEAIGALFPDSGTRRVIIT